MQREPDIDAPGGIQVRNGRNELVLWFKSGRADDGSIIAFCLYRPELADPKLHHKLSNTFNELKAMAKSMCVPLFDVQEVNREVKRMKEELDGSKATGVENNAPDVRTNKQEAVTITLTDVATGLKCKVCAGVLWIPERLSGLQGGMT